MNIIYATYNIHHDSIDVSTHAGFFLRIDCNKAEEGLKTTSCSECAINALAIDEPPEYADVGRCGRFSGRLAGKFEVSSRTIMRDLESLDQAGIQIQSFYGVEGGYQIMNSFVLENRLQQVTNMTGSSLL